MNKYLNILELKAALYEINQRKGLPVQFLTTPTQSFVRFKVVRNFSTYRRQFTYNQSPYEIIQSLNQLPDLNPKYNWSLLGRFL